MSDLNDWDNGNKEKEELSTDAESVIVDVPAREITEESADLAESADPVDTQGVFSGSRRNDTNYDSNPYGAQQNNNPYDGDSYNGRQGSNPYGGNPYHGQQGSNPYGGNPYVGQQNGNPYGGNPYGGQQGSNPYGGNPYGGQQNGNPNGGNPYGGQQNSNPYGGNSYNGQQNGNPYGGNPYGGQQNSNPYGGNSYNGQQGSNPYGNNSYDGPQNNYPYSPYAVPQKKSNTGLIVAIIVVLIILFLTAVLALVYKAVKMVSDQKTRVDYNQNDYNFDDDFDYDYDYDYDYDDDFDYNYHDGYDYDGGYDYHDGYDYDDDYDYDDKYYTLHDDIKAGLDYSVEFEYYEYDTDYENVSILVSYPVIKGKNVPNLEKLNEEIQEETSYLTEYFEDEYAELLDENKDSYFNAFSSGYVTYMDEEKMSIVFSETVYSDYFSHAYLYCINIDMENGVVLDNEHMLAIDDDFSVDFRNRSDEQNGEISYLSLLTDQQITEYFNSPDVIVFYTPMGMEIGFNYEQGWVTVTYEEYEEYLKVF